MKTWTYLHQFTFYGPPTEMLICIIIWLISNIFNAYFHKLIYFFRFFAIFAPYPAIYPVCIRPMTLDRENSWLKPSAGWPLKTGFENQNSGAGGTVQDLPMCPCTSWCSIGHMWHRHQNCKRSLNNILYIYTFTFLSNLAINNQICYWYLSFDINFGRMELLQFLFFKKYQS